MKYINGELLRGAIAGSLEEFVKIRNAIKDIAPEGDLASGIAEGIITANEGILRMIDAVLENDYIEINKTIYEDLADKITHERLDSVESHLNYAYRRGVSDAIEMIEAEGAKYEHHEQVQAE